MRGDPPVTEHWHPLIAIDAFPADGKYAAKIAGWFVLVVRTDDGWVALNDRCTHQAAMLSDGRIRRGTIMCPLHGARFDLTTGKCLGAPYGDLRRFSLRAEQGMIEVAVPDAPPGIDEIPIRS